MKFTRASAALASLAVGSAAEQTFTEHNGQIFTPGFVIFNSPQPWTPMGGDTLHISLDVTANGKLPLLLDDESRSRIHNITVFLSSYETGRNFTISNGTAGEDDASLGDIMSQEPQSTVKHVNWIWPDCLVGDGEPDDDSSDRGLYNISVRQSFRLNDTDHYTIFDLPIKVTNSIEEDEDRPSCDALDNELLTPEDIDIETANELGILFAPDSSTEIDYETAPTESDHDGEDDPDLGGEREEAGPGDGLGGAGMLEISWVAMLVTGALLGLAMGI